jgi:hypothetical protein
VLLRGNRHRRVDPTVLLLTDSVAFSSKFDLALLSKGAVESDRFY